MALGRAGRERKGEPAYARAGNASTVRGARPAASLIKLLAKIGHGFVVAERRDFRPVLPNLIRSARDSSVEDALYFIGGAREQDERQWQPGLGVHRVAHKIYRKDGFPLVHAAIVQLFALIGSPTYEVIVGFPAS